MRLKNHHIYLFTLKNGKKRLAYGETPEHAKKILSYRMTQEEMDELTADEPEIVAQRDLQGWVEHLG